MHDIYTTGEMIDLIKSNKTLLFEAYIGKYEGNIVKYDDYTNSILWQDNSLINIDNGFLQTKWRLMSSKPVYIQSQVPNNYLYAFVVS